nr:MAG TPA: hypothetical protein [Caudoviricetes sp.]
MTLHITPILLIYTTHPGLSTLGQQFYCLRSIYIKVVLLAIFEKNFSPPLILTSHIFQGCL